MKVTPTIRQNIKKEMESNGITFSDLARELGLKSRGHISEAVNGNRDLKEEYIEKMARLFQVRKKYLLGKDEYRTEHDYTLALSGADAALAAENAKKFEALTGLFELFGVKIEQVPVAIFTINKKGEQPPYTPPYTPKTTKEECKALDRYIADKSERWKDFVHAAYQFASMTDAERQELYNKKSLTEEQWSNMTIYEISEYGRPIINGYDVDKEYCFTLNEIPPNSKAYLNMSAILAPVGSYIPIEQTTRFPYTVRILARVTLPDGTIQYLTAAHLADVVRTIIYNGSSLLKNLLDLSDIRKDISPVC